MKEQVEVRELKEGRYVIIDDEPCIIKANIPLKAREAWFSQGQG